MKKYFKLIIILIIILVTSCQTKTDELLNTNSEGIVTGSNNLFEVSSNAFFFSDIKEIYGYDYSEDRDNWYNLVESKFNIKLKVNSIYSDLAAIYGHKNYNLIKENIEDKNITGLFKVPDINILQKLIDENLVLPFDAYLSENSNWNNAPSDWKEAFKYDNDTWAISVNYSDEIFTRHIRGDWLDNLNLNAPTSIDELYETFVKFTYNDPDLDKLDNTSGAYFFTTQGLEDIFAAYDVRLNYNGLFQPTWNPNTNTWEDSMLKPEMEECITFLKNCIEEKVIVNNLPVTDGFFSYNDFHRGYAGSYSSWIRNGNDLILETILKYRPETVNPFIRVIPGLTHNISENINGYYTSHRQPYVLLKNSLDPKSTANILIDDFISNKDGFLMGQFGLSEVSYNTEKDSVYTTTTVEKGIKYPYQGPSIIGRSPFFDFSVYRYYQDFTLIEKSNNSMEIAKNNILCYEIPWEIVRPTIDDKTSDSLLVLGNFAKNIISGVLDGNIQFVEAINKYRVEAKKLGMQEYLNEQNIRLGVLPTQIY